LPQHFNAKSSRARLEWLLFLTLWFAYGVAINSGNLNAFGLQQAGVEAYVERQHLYLEGSRVERLHVQPVIDAFLYQGHIYPAKQPGQFMFGACAYFPLHAAGLSYAENYLLTAALVTFLTASLITAAASVAVFRLAREFAPNSRERELAPDPRGHELASDSHGRGRATDSRELASDAGSLFWPLLAALSYGLATTAFAYSGIAWHDALATGYLTIALYLSVRLRREGSGRKATALAACAGLLLGLTVTTSMLPFFMALALALYFVTLRRWKLTAVFLFGGALGLLPLLVYNSICFGNPLLLPNVAGNYSDTFFRLDWTNFKDKLSFYAHMLTLYAPVFWLGLLGLALYPRALRREQAFVCLMLFALAAYLLNIEANGTCQYGPRYLLPAMPLACLGLAGFAYLRAAKLRLIAGATATICALASFLINLVGAMHGAMLCDFPHSALARYLSEMTNGQMRSYPLAPWLLLPLLVCLAFFAHTLAARRRAAGDAFTRA
ncbi:MAG: hypothetical protein M3379_19560, partial [Acidobacteriota bacterium]|nr:hypothetical protein [Acidobacteriota bacterium]